MIIEMQKTESLSAAIRSFLLGFGAVLLGAAADFSWFGCVQEEKTLRQIKHKRNLRTIFITELKA
jgi:hypothetical protein